MSTWTGSPALPAFLAGDIPQAATDWASIIQALHALSDAWSSFTPSWTTTGTAPALGNGTISAHWIQVGKFIVDYGALIFGSTSTFGTGTFGLSTPVTISGFQGQAGGVFACFDNDLSTAHRPGTFFPNTGTISSLFSTTGGVDATDPFTWAANDSIRWVRVFEGA